MRPSWRTVRGGRSSTSRRTWRSRGGSRSTAGRSVSTPRRCGGRRGCRRGGCCCGCKTRRSIDPGAQGRGWGGRVVVVDRGRWGGRVVVVVLVVVLVGRVVVLLVVEVVVVVDTVVLVVGLGLVVEVVVLVEALLVCPGGSW